MKKAENGLLCWRTGLEWLPPSGAQFIVPQCLSSLDFCRRLGLSFLADSMFHVVMVVVCSLIAIVAFIPGWNRHRRFLPLAIAGIGLSLISVAAFAFEDDCCSAPAESTKEVANVTNAANSVADEAQTEESATRCTADCCAHLSEDGVAIDASSGKNGTFSSFVPWITPLGGLLLVVAHLTNRQYSRSCSCCEE